MAIGRGPDAGDDIQDPQLARWYREAGGPEPSPALDQAILAAAHREVHARPGAVGAALRGWRMPLALAAVVVLSVTVVTLVSERDGELAGVGAPAPGPEEPAPQGAGATQEARKEPQSRAPATSAERAHLPQAPAALKPAQSGEGKHVTPLQHARRERPDAAQFAPPPTAPPSAQAPPSASGQVAAGGPDAVRGAPEPSRQDSAQPGESPRDDTGRSPAPAPTPLAVQPRKEVLAEQRSLSRQQASATTAPSDSEVARLLKALENQPPERWLEKVEELRRAGRQAESDELLAAFRKRFPEYPVPSAR